MAVAKPVHIVIWGASGFTGRLVAEHCARDYSNGQLNWAIAGRSQSKLESIRAELAKQYGDRINSVPILVGDIQDPASMDAIASQTKVIISTAGPFAKIGSPVVEAAVRNGTHYCDITGETPWVKEMIEHHHDEAVKKGVRIVHCCGYDSVPSDIGSWFIVDQMKKKFKKKPIDIENVLMKGKGGFSGGTIASGLHISEEQAKRKGMENSIDLSSPYCLIPKGMDPGSDMDRWVNIDKSKTLNTWLGPFIMQLCNSRVVHRSNYLLDWGGPKLHYQEAIGAPSWLKAKLVALGTVLAAVMFSQTWMHPLLRKLLPAQGEGPSREEMLTGFWQHRIAGVSEDGDVVIAEMKDPHRDPGYWGTSRMLLEAGLTLALHLQELDASPDVLHGGVLTPASALGEVYLKRLRNAGITFDVIEARSSTTAGSSDN